MSRFRLVVSLLVLAILVSCAAFHRHPTTGLRTAAAIAVRGDGSVDQDTITLQARNSGAACPISWKADVGNKLMIEWEDPGQKCIVGKVCKDNVCTAQTNAALSARTECRYKVWINSTVAKDPIVVVENCCP